MYRDIPISQRVDRIGEILAKGVYLYLKKEKVTIKSDRVEKKGLIVLLRKKKVNKLSKCVNMAVQKEI